jgi:hypothetical protein
MKALYGIPGTYVEQRGVAAVSASTATGAIGIFVAPFRCKVTRIAYAPVIKLTGANTNSMNLNVTLADGTEVANIDFAEGVDAEKGEETNIAITSPITLDAGETLLVVREKVGTGLEMPLGAIIFEYEGA